MKIIVLADDDKWEELTVGITSVELERVSEFADFSKHSKSDAFFNLYDDAFMWDYSQITQPMFLNSVNTCLKDIKGGRNVIRMNGWNGFIKRSTWEMSGEITDDIVQIISAIKKKIIPISDVPGFVSARVISMIINEAYFALEQKISSREEIDTAMKLGTNYPFGPFEWGNLIRMENVYNLLLMMGRENKKYLPCESMYQSEWI